MCHSKANYLLVLSLLVSLLISACAANIVQAKPTAAEPLKEAPASSASTLPAIEQSPATDETKIYTSKVGGYSFQYPSSWVVIDLVADMYPSQIRPASVAIYPSADSPRDIETRIGISYEIFEIEEGDDLLEWVNIYQSVIGEPHYELAFSASDLDSRLLPSGSQQVYGESTENSFFPMQAYYITHGNLVLQIAKFTPDPAQNRYLLKAIAQSITFSSDAPTSQEQLYSPGQDPNGGKSLREYIEFLQGFDLVNQALDIRMQTGETPTELLDQMSDWQRQRYEAILKSDQEIFEELDRQRTQPPPSTPGNPQQQYKEYRKSEEEGHPPAPDEGSYQQREPLPVGARRLSGVRQQSQCSPQQCLQGDEPGLHWGLKNRRGLATRYTTPIRVYDKQISCGSPYHINKETYAIDIGDIVNIEVYATTQAEEVTDTQIWDGVNPGWGTYVTTKSQQAVNEAYKNYLEIFNLWVHNESIYCADCDRGQ